MKTKEYVEKYKLNIDDQFDHNEFVIDLRNDFIILLEVGKAYERWHGFQNAVNAIRSKWDGINNKTKGQLPESLWKYFYASVICEMRESLFPEQVRKQREEREQRQREREQRRNHYDDYFSAYFHFSFQDFIFNSLRELIKNQVPTKSFEVLGIKIEGATIEQVNKSYRLLSLQHHPDKGGDSEVFIAITKAKDNCINYLQKL